MLKIKYPLDNWVHVIIKKMVGQSEPSEDSASTRKEKKAQMRDTVARVAFELFMEQGYDKTTMRQIAYRAKILNGSLYNLFPSKDHIFDYIFMHTIEKRKEKCNHLLEQDMDYMTALALPYLLELHIAKEIPKVGELFHEAYSNWGTFDKIVDLDTEWISTVSGRFGVPFDENHIRQVMISVDGSFTKFVDRYLYTGDGDVQEDLRTLIIQLFTLMNLPLHSLDTLMQRYSELKDSSDTWMDLELWPSE